MTSLRRTLGKSGDLALVGGTVGILMVLFMPIPSGLLDFLVVLNFSLALLLLLLTFFMEKPVEFSTFPSLLLIVTLFRLSLNVAATRLILSDADAGRVIGAIGSYVVGGNYVVGVVVFIILVVVQYVVVTNGAQRVAEVAARFTLDSMPGQQMSIDADLNMGLIDQAEAQRRRKSIEKEANFYGAMDGASKFVKGDAIAGIIILIVNIIGGFAVGVGQLGMKWDEALRTFTLLTIGDGIVTQLPALVIAVGTGIIVTRSASDERLSAEVTKQIFSVPRALLFVSVALLAFAAMPSMPAWPALTVCALALVAWWVIRRVKAVAGEIEQAEEAALSEGEQELVDLLTVHPVSVRVGKGLVSWFAENNALLLDRVQGLRKQIAGELGVVIPDVRIMDDARLPANSYQVHFHGVLVGEADLYPELKLAIHPPGDKPRLAGIETRDPSYGLAAVWIDHGAAEQAPAKGYVLVDPLTVIMTHANELLRRQAPLLMTRAETEQALARVRKQNPGLLEELVPTVLSVTDIQKVLQNLLHERVSIRNLILILEELADRARFTKDFEELTEHVRRKLGAIICQGLRNQKGEMTVLTLDPAIENAIAQSLRNVSDTTTLVLDPRFAEQVAARTAAQVEQMMKRNLLPVLLCAPELRRHLRKFLERMLPNLTVLSLSEVPNDANLKSFAVVTI
ncbi:MAG: flagellar biosynthesis protein FlhA [Rhodocyclaceae bacterium]